MFLYFPFKPTHDVVFVNLVILFSINIFEVYLISLMNYNIVTRKVIVRSPYPLYFDESIDESRSTITGMTQILLVKQKLLDGLASQKPNYIG